MSQSPLLCPPEARLAGAMDSQIEAAIKYLEREAEAVMGALHCGSDNSDYRHANAAADANWFGAAALRLMLKKKKARRSIR